MKRSKISTKLYLSLTIKCFFYFRYNIFVFGLKPIEFFLNAQNKVFPIDHFNSNYYIIPLKNNNL